MINLIDENSNFNEQLRQFPSSSATIAIFGSQSSGKSTLMNDVFQTNFPRLDTKKDRKRCTKGILFQTTSKYNILDTQGFDSAQRSFQQRIFQRQIALFCLAISDIIIVNLWMNQIGRYEGSQLHILKAIMNASYRLIKSQQKIIIFVVKDCTQDSNKIVLRQALQNTINSILRQLPNTKQSIKFNFQYVFLSHYIYRHEEYLKQIKQFHIITKIRKSILKQYSSKDRMIYLTHLWKTIKQNKKQIDLRVSEQALRQFIVERIRRQVASHITQQVKLVKKLTKQKNYERFYEFYIKKSFQQIKKQLPLYISEDVLKTQYFLLQQELQYEIQKHFTNVILPVEENYILTNTLIKQLRNSFQSVRLQKVINQQRKKALQQYRNLLQGHKQVNILSRLFTQKINSESIGYERQVNHIFNIFQTNLQSLINKEIDNQMSVGQFKGFKVTQKIKKLCLTFQYNDWEVNLSEIWQKSSHRILNKKIPEKIDRLTGKLNYSIFQEGKQAQIIAFHKKLEKNLQDFCQKMLQYFQQEQNIDQYKEKIKEKINQSLSKCLLREKHRFHVTLIMLGIFLFFISGQIIFILKMFSFKKRSRRYFGYLLNIVILIVFITGLLKQKIRNNNDRNRTL